MKQHIYYGIPHVYLYVKWLKQHHTYHAKPPWMKTQYTMYTAWGTPSLMLGYSLSTILIIYKHSLDQVRIALRRQQIGTSLVRPTFHVSPTPTATAKLTVSWCKSTSVYSLPQAHGKWSKTLTRNISIYMNIQIYIYIIYVGHRSKTAPQLLAISLIVQICFSMMNW